VIHHTDCGILFFTNEVIRGLLANSLETAELGSNGFRDVGTGPGPRAREFIEWLTIPDAGQSVVDDVTHSKPSACSIQHSGLRIHLRRQIGTAY
jgi:carbonic anhydrase